jgi:hypothetical protein
MNAEFLQTETYVEFIFPVNASRYISSW